MHKAMMKEMVLGPVGDVNVTYKTSLPVALHMHSWLPSDYLLHFTDFYNEINAHSFMIRIPKSTQTVNS